MPDRRDRDATRRETSMIAAKGKVKLLDGNAAAACGALLCKPDVIAGYPITPQTSILEHLHRFRADGLLDAEIINTEGEHSALSVLTGVSAAGGRTFTATSGQGLAFMYEPYHMASTLRLPIVMVLVTREMDVTVTAGEQDAIGVRDAGWIQIYVESCQEILDSIIMAYKVAEAPEVLLPLNVCYDGFYLSHLSERVEIPAQENVDNFLPPLKKQSRLDPESPMHLCIGIPPPLLTEARYKQCAAFQTAKQKIDQVDREFYRIFGRSYGGLIEEYRLEDAQIVLVAMGSCAGTIKVVVDKKRETGLKVGLVKVRVLRPFPHERLAHVLRGKKGIGVIDRNVCFGWNRGTLAMELESALRSADALMPVVSFIDGLAGSDITVEHIERAVDITSKAAQGIATKEAVWLALD